MNDCELQPQLINLRQGVFFFPSLERQEAVQISKAGKKIDYFLICHTNTKGWTFSFLLKILNSLSVLFLSDEVVMFTTEELDSSVQMINYLFLSLRVLSQNKTIAVDPSSWLPCSRSTIMGILLCSGHFFAKIWELEQVRRRRQRERH